MKNKGFTLIELIIAIAIFIILAATIIPSVVSYMVNQAVVEESQKEESQTQQPTIEYKEETLPDENKNESGEMKKL